MVNVMTQDNVLEKLLFELKVFKFRLSDRFKVVTD